MNVRTLNDDLVALLSELNVDLREAFWNEVCRGVLLCAVTWHNVRTHRDLITALDLLAGAHPTTGMWPGATSNKAARILLAQVRLHSCACLTTPTSSTSPDCARECDATVLFDTIRGGMHDLLSERGI